MVQRSSWRKSKRIKILGKEISSSPSAPSRRGVIGSTFSTKITDPMQFNLYSPPQPVSYDAPSASLFTSWIENDYGLSTSVDDLGNDILYYWLDKAPLIVDWNDAENKPKVYIKQPNINDFPTAYFIRCGSNGATSEMQTRLDQFDPNQEVNNVSNAYNILGQSGSNWHFWAVINPENISTNDGTLRYNHHVATTTGGHWGVYISTNGVYAHILESLFNTQRTTQPYISINAGEWYLVEAWYEVEGPQHTGTLYCKVGNTIASASCNDGYYSNQAGGFRVGGRGITNPLSGNLAAMIVTSSSLSQDEIIATRTYLGEKYGVDY